MRYSGVSIFLCICVASGLVAAAGAASLAPAWVETEESAAIFHDVETLGDGRFAAVGHDGRRGGGTGASGFLAIVDSDGTIHRSSAVRGGSGSVLYGVTTLSNGDVVAVGKSGGGSTLNRGEHWAARVRPNGSVVWSRRYSFEHEGRLRDVVALGNGSVLAVGSEMFDGGLAIQIGPDGSRQWNRFYDGVSFDSVVGTENGYVIVGQEQSGYGRHEQAWALSVDRSGDVQWEREFNGTLDRFFDVTTTERGYLVAGNAGTLVEFDRTGTVVRRDQIGAVSGAVESVARRSPDETVVCDSNGSEIGQILRIDENATVERRKTVIQSDREMGACRSIQHLEGSQYVAVGSIQPRYGIYRNGWLHVTDQREPVVRGEVSPTSGETGITTFELDVSGSQDNRQIQYYRWDVDGDGTHDENSVEPRTTAVYETTGTVRANVTAIDTDGNRNTTTIAVTVRDTTSPTVGLAAPNPRYVATTAPARLDAGESSDNHRIAEYQWDFDDDGTVDATTNDSSTTHLFEEPGRHRIAVTAVDASGNENTSRFPLQTAENTAPNVSVTPGGIAVVGRRTVLRAEVTDRVGTPTVEWRLPNGSTATGRTVAYTFEEAGNRSLDLTLTDEYGMVTRWNGTVEVRSTYPSDNVGPSDGTDRDESYESEDVESDSVNDTGDSKVLAALAGGATGLSIGLTVVLWFVWRQ